MLVGKRTVLVVFDQIQNNFLKFINVFDISSYILYIYIQSIYKFTMYTELHRKYKLSGAIGPSSDGNLVTSVLIQFDSYSLF